MPNLFSDDLYRLDMVSSPDSINSSAMEKGDTLGSPAQGSRVYREREGMDEGKIRVESHIERRHQLETEKKNPAPPIVRTTVEGMFCIYYTIYLLSIQHIKYKPIQNVCSANFKL